MSDEHAFLYEIFEHQKTALLVALLKNHPEQKSNLIIVRSRDTLHALVSDLNRSNLVADSLHGNKKPELRTRTLREFSEGKFPILVSTGSMIREATLPDQCNIIYFEPPEGDEDFLSHLRQGHRVISILTQHESAQSTRLGNLAHDLIRLRLENFPYDSQPKHQKSPRKGNRTDSKPLQHKKPKLKNKGPRRKTGRTRKR